MKKLAIDTDSTANRLKRRPIRNLNEHRNGLGISFEYFPVENQFAVNQLRRASRILDRFNPRFTSVTFGAGGSKETEAFRIVRLLQKVCTPPVAAHIINEGFGSEEVDELVQRAAMMGVTRFVVLRGDARHQDNFNPANPRYPDTVAMIEGVSCLGDFDISVSGYPETHPLAKSQKDDIDFLKRKVDAGADRVLCQMCFDSDKFLRFRDRAVAAGIDVPIVPGVMPIHDFPKVKSFAEKCKVSIPVELDRLFSELPSSRDIFNVVSSTVTAEYCTRLIDNGVGDMHFYTMNRFELVRSVCHILGVKETRSEAFDKAQSTKSAHLY